MSEFVPASELYDVENQTPIAHPAHQATDADVRQALEDREVRTDGGQSSSGTGRSGRIYSSPSVKISVSSRVRNDVSSQEHALLGLTGWIVPSSKSHTVSTLSQFSQVPSTFSLSLFSSEGLIKPISLLLVHTHTLLAKLFRFRYFQRSRQTATDYKDGGSR